MIAQQNGRNCSQLPHGWGSYAAWNCTSHDFFFRWYSKSSCLNIWICMVSDFRTTRGTAELPQTFFSLPVKAVRGLIQVYGEGACYCLLRPLHLEASSSTQHAMGGRSKQAHTRQNQSLCPWRTCKWFAVSEFSLSPSMKPALQTNCSTPAASPSLFSNTGLNQRINLNTAGTNSILSVKYCF